MVRRKVFEELGGFDERLRVESGDVDFCLRAQERGYRVVYASYAVLYHLEGATRGVGKATLWDRDGFTKRWRGLLDKGDPYYNPNLDKMRSYRIRIT